VILYNDVNLQHKIGKGKYTEIPEAFFKPQRGWWRQQVVSVITPSQMQCGLRLLLLERNNKRNDGLQGHWCDVIPGHCCKPTITSVSTIISVPQQ
jgi:hypothetical protein